MVLLHTAMALRNYIRNVTCFSNSIRSYSSTTSPLINLQINEKTGIATATLQRPPVNSLNLEMLTELLNILNDLEETKSRGLILTSSSNTVFSAGLDISELCKPDTNRFKQWSSTFQQTWIKLYGSSYPSVAVINGHSPAGGCLLALCCEYRIMLPNFTIGLNETQLGLTAPTWFIASMKNAIGLRQTELALTTGTLFKTDEALKIGLVDEVAATKDEAIAKADIFFQRFAKVSPQARTITKRMLRGADIKELEGKLDKETREMEIFYQQPHVQETLKLYMASLKIKEKK